MKYFLSGQKPLPVENFRNRNRNNAPDNDDAKKEDEISANISTLFQSTNQSSDDEQLLRSRDVSIQFVFLFCDLKEDLKCIF